MFSIVLDLTYPKMGLIAGLSVLVIKLDAFKFDVVVKSGNTDGVAVITKWSMKSFPVTGSLA